MQVDLLRTKKGMLGILADGPFEETISGVSFEEETQTVILEMAEAMDSVQLNIPVSFDFWQDVLNTRTVYIGVVQLGMLSQAGVVPMISGKYAGLGMPPGRILPIAHFLNFMGEVESGQALHRDDLGETSSGAVTGGVSPAAIKLAPQLEHSLQLEKNAELTHAPTLAPPTPSGPGGLGGSSAQTLNLQNRHPKPPTNTDGGEGKK